MTSDHGEALGENGRAGHNNLLENNLLVPLFIAAPGIAPGGREVERQVRSVDIVPTLLEAVGLESQQPTDGVSLLPLMKGDVPSWEGDAWTYAASANLGLSLRREDSTKFLFNDAAFQPLSGQAQELQLIAGEEVPKTLEDPLLDLQPMVDLTALRWLSYATESAWTLPTSAMVFCASGCLSSGFGRPVSSWPERLANVCRGTRAAMVR